MKRIVITLALALLPITATQTAQAGVCTWKTRQVKDTYSQPYTKYKYVTYRSCSKRGSSR
jgi:hypothetical protein